MRRGIDIIKAANGFIVRPAYDATNDAFGEPHVFETFEAMVEHLRKMLVYEERLAAALAVKHA